jgi:hypothetical protein
MANSELDHLVSSLRQKVLINARNAPSAVGRETWPRFGDVPSYLPGPGGSSCALTTVPRRTPGQGGGISRGAAYALGGRH